jgi:hypothetical protein
MIRIDLIPKVQLKSNVLSENYGLSSNSFTLVNSCATWVKIKISKLT